MADTTLPHNIPDSHRTGDGFWSNGERRPLSSNWSPRDSDWTLGSDAVGSVSKRGGNGLGSQSELIPPGTTGPVDLASGKVGDGVDPRYRHMRDPEISDYEVSRSEGAFGLSRSESSAAALKNRILRIVVTAAGVSAVIFAVAAYAVGGDVRRNQAAALRHHLDDWQHLNKIDHNRLFGVYSQNLLVAE